MRRLISAAAVLATAAALLSFAPTSASELQPWQQNIEILDVWNRQSSPVIADIDGVPGNEIVFGTQDGYVRAYNGDGTRKWEAAAIPGTGPGCNAQSFPSAVDSSPAVADLDKDGIPEVVVGVGSAFHADQNGSVIAFDGATGAIEWQTDNARDVNDIWSGDVNPDGWCEATFVTPAIGDVDGDGWDEVVFGSWDFYIWAVDRFGEPLPGFPFDNDDTIWSSPALFDIDGDGRQEIFIGGDSSSGPGGQFDHAGGFFRALDWNNGILTELWNRMPTEVVQGSPAIGDINGDGRPEAIVTTGEYWNITCSNPNWWQCSSDSGDDHRYVFAFHLDDGSDVPGWPVALGDTNTASPALGDLDGNGNPEVVVGSWDDQVYAIRGNGSIMWSQIPTTGHPAFERADITGHPIIADLDGDGDQDVAVGSRHGLGLLDGQTGLNLEKDGDGNDLIWQYRMGIGWSMENAPAVGVLDGRRQIFFTQFNTSQGTTRVAAFDLPNTSATDAWPMFRQNPARTGRVHADLCEMNGASGSFCDVPDGTYFTEAVEWMVAESITAGVSPTLFGPDFDLTRAQMVTFLWRQGGEPIGYPPHGFGDVPAGAYYEDAVAWAKAEEITTGTSTSTFSPGTIVTRAQLVTLLWRRAGSPGGYPDPGFDDVPAGTYFTQAVAWAKAEDITGGFSASIFAPHSPVTRAQAAALVWREAGRP